MNYLKLPKFRGTGREGGISQSITEGEGRGDNASQLNKEKL